MCVGPSRGRPLERGGYLFEHRGQLVEDRTHRPFDQAFGIYWEEVVVRQGHRSPHEGVEEAVGGEAGVRGCKTITRIAEIAAWLTNRFLSEKNTAAAIARATGPICTGPTPIKDTTRSAMSSPMATPKTTSTVRLPRCPSVNPKR